MNDYCDQTDKPVKECDCQQHMAGRHLAMNQARKDFHEAADKYKGNPSRGNWFRLKEAGLKLSRFEDQ